MDVLLQLLILRIKKLLKHVEKTEWEQKFCTLTFIQSKSQTQWIYMARCKQACMCANHSYQTVTLSETQGALDVVQELRAVDFLK